MKLVVLESPYAGNVERNVAYARRALRDCLRRGEAPIASHLLITQVLDDSVREEREIGIAAGVAWHRVADLVVFYMDHGMSNGMAAAKARADSYGVATEIRYLDKTPDA